MYFRAQLADDVVPWLGHERDDVVLLSDGSLFAMCELQGASFETLEDELLDERKVRLNQTYSQIAHDSITLTIWQHRGPANPSVYPDPPASAGFASELSLSYKAHLFDQSLYENRTFLGVRVRPPTYQKVHREFLSFGHSAPEVSEDQLIQIDDILKLLSAELQDYRPRRIGVRLWDDRTFSEIAETVVWLMTGVWRSIGMTTGLLAEAMFSEHIEVGWDGTKFINPGGIRFAASFSIQTYCAKTKPSMLGQLLTSSYEYTIQHSFRFVPFTASLEIISRKNFFMTRASDPAKEQIAKLENLKEAIANREVVLGDHSCSVLVFADTEQALEKTAPGAWTDLAASGAKIVRETLGLKPAFLSMIPGNEHMKPRSGYVTSLNMASFAPMQSYPTGPLKGHWGAPIVMFRSLAGTPVYFHWQVDDVGNTLVTGETGSGKSLLVGFLMAMTGSRAKIFALDHKRGWQMLISAMGGRYSVLGGGEPNFAPLKSLSDKPDDVAFLMDLIRGCIMSDGFGELTAEQDERLALGIRMVMSLDAADRSMSEVRAFLGIDRNGPGARLEKWCHGKELGWVIDAPSDAVSLKGWLHGHDTTALLDIPRARGPALLYMFYRIRKQLTGDPALVVIDEGWRALLDDVFRPAIEQQLRTIRSRNGAVVFVTQGAGDILDTRIANVLVEQCPTQIHLPNPRATERDYCLGLKRTRGEFNVLKRLPKGSGMFLLCRGAESMVAQLDLRGMDDFISVLSSRESTLKLFDKAMAAAKNDAQKALPLFHVARREEAEI